MGQGPTRTPRRRARALLFLPLVSVGAHSAGAQESPPLIGSIQPVLVSECVEPTGSSGLLFNDLAIDFSLLESHCDDILCPTCTGICEGHDGAHWVLIAVGFSVVHDEAPDYSNDQFVSELRFMGMAPSPGAWVIAVPAALAAIRRSRRST